MLRLRLKDVKRPSEAVIRRLTSAGTRALGEKVMPRGLTFRVT